MMYILLLLLLVVLLDIAALLWGADSRDGPESPEWRRRSSWFLPIDHGGPRGRGSKKSYLDLYRRTPYEERTF
ncbi:hypothetical protein [Thermogemmatispora sp.]|uniref:hypothetical protein n=1 Tax=Thermogemmatispora sp. TaxID=1968838 RepID=UPI0035E41901